jgi:hypothetical protein
MPRRIATKEEKIATKLTDSVADLTLNLDEVGKHMATTPTILVDRLQVVMEAAREEKVSLYEGLGITDYDY